MKSIILTAVSLLVVTGTFFIDLPGNKEPEQVRGKYTIVVHGGAGTIEKSIPDSVKQKYIKSLSKALSIGKEVLENGGKSLDAVEQVIRFLEDDPKFNASKGAVFTSEGTHELDASIMDGSNLSTGGLANKMVGRIGDSPLINAGTYANNKTCAVSGTGTGEEFIRNTIAYNVSALMEFKGLTLKEAANEVIFNILKKDDGGIIAVDKDGNYATPFNTLGMYRGIATSDGVFEIKIWE
jgi:beta-aspartyl-peptidase (threonine type)